MSQNSEIPNEKCELSSERERHNDLRICSGNMINHKRTWAWITIGFVVILTAVVLFQKARVARAGATFFPIKKAAANYGLSEFEATWYSGVLLRMGERSLLSASRDPELRSYRLMIL